MSGATFLRRVAVRLGLMRRPPPPQPAVFDAAWYRAQLPGTDVTPQKAWQHYSWHGWRQGLSPSPIFDTVRYLRLYADIRDAGTEPLWHYLTLGWREDRSPHALFDPAWYAQQRRPDSDPLTDYLTQGWEAGCSPHPLFHVAHYRARRGGVPDRCDLIDYLTTGWRAGFDPHPWFSIEHYRQTAALGPDVEPLLHHVESGFRSAASPHPDFDPAYYRARYLLSHREPPDPLADFVTTGWILGRQPCANAPADWRSEAFRVLGPQGSLASSPTA
jgi:hypothetical protein